MASKPRIYIDACYYIDVAKGRLSQSLDKDREEHLPFVEAMFLAAADGVIEIWGSTLLIAECLATEKQQLTVPEDVQQMFVSLLSSGSVVKLAAADPFTTERARDLLWVNEIRCGGGADSIHVATALELGCEEFVSTNRKRGPLNADAAQKLGALGLRVIEAPSTQVLPPKYRPAGLFT